MSITITGTQKIQKRLNKLSHAITEKDLTKVTSEARNRIQKRTNQGRTAAGGTFKPLTEKYRTYKIAKGRVGKPNLHFKGDLLRGMDVGSISKWVKKIYFPDETERKKAEGHHFGRGNLPRRSFFRLGKKIEKYIFNELHKPVKKALT